MLACKLGVASGVLDWAIKDGVSEQNGWGGGHKGLQDYTPRAYESEQNVPLSPKVLGIPSQNGQKIEILMAAAPLPSTRARRRRRRRRMGRRLPALNLSE